jgi:hypothetical protein
MSMPRWNLTRLDISSWEIGDKNKMTTKMEENSTITLGDDTSTNITSTMEFCEQEFGRHYCSDHGTCYKSFKDGVLKPYCVCDKSHEGDRCQYKTIDFPYSTPSKSNNDNNNSSNISDAQTEEADDEVRVISVEETSQTNNNNSSAAADGVERREESPNHQGEKCPYPYDLDFCLNGECFAIYFGSEPEFFCECFKPYHGLRCEQKAPEGSYSDMLRNRRHVRKRSKQPNNLVKILLILNNLIKGRRARRRRTKTTDSVLNLVESSSS